MHVIGRVLVYRKRWDQSTKRRPSRKCFFKPRNTDMISLAMLCGTLKKKVIEFSKTAPLNSFLEKDQRGQF